MLHFDPKTIQIEEAPRLSIVLRYFYSELDAELRRLYPATPILGVTDQERERGALTAFVMRAREEALGCVAVRELGDGVGEIKRMFVRREARGLGLGRRLLDAAERHAHARKLRELRVGTGELQAAALALYRSSGYERIEPFGEFAADETAQCFAKSLEA